MSSPTHILIVEDEDVVAQDLQAMLRRMGYHVPMSVGTGRLAVETARLNRPDLILMDFQLAGEVDGVQAAAAILAERDVPIVYLTDAWDKDALRRAKGTAPFGFLVRPFEERAIQAGIEMALYKHQAERESRTREQWLTTTLTSIADAVITTDREGKVTFLNAAAERLSGWTQAEALRRRYDEVFQTLDEATRLPATDRVALALADALSGRFSNHLVLVRRDATEVHIEHSVAPIRQRAELPIDGCVIVFSDVTERKDLEERLRQVQKMDAIGKLAGGIAHDFNNAITAIVGYAEMMLLQIDETSPIYKDAKQIIRAAEHSARLTHQLLAFTRKQVLQPRSLDLHEVLSQVYGMVRRLIGENITLSLDAAPDVWNTMADEGQVHQVVLNMAINARDAMPGGGELKFALSNATVSVAEALRIPDGVPGEYVLLTVSDTGTGMSRETMGRIFEPFFTTKDPSKGTGLGLATCHGIIKQTNGMVTVVSTPGAGTTFSIYLPKAQEGAEADAVRPSDQGDSPRGTETILLVEDEDILRELGMEVLTSLGYEVITAPDGAAAVEILSGEARQRIDMVATDLVMPRMNGRELNAWINKNAWGMRVLFMSGYTDDEIVRTAVQGAEVQFLQKPFTPDALARKIRQVLDGRKTRQAA